MLEPKLQSIVEQLCSEGCQQVSVYIKEIEARQMPDSMQELSDSHQQLVLEELKSIMAVYDNCELP